MAGDKPDSDGRFTATEVELKNEECNDGICDAPEITGPIQAPFDPNTKSVTILGLEIDLSNATIEGADDEDNPDNKQSADLSQLAEGQFVEVELASDQPPLAATELEIKNFTNQVHINILGERGEIISGKTRNIKIAVRANASQAGKIVKLRTSSNGSCTLAGLPSGKAKIVVTRNIGRHKSMCSRLVQVKGNSTKNLNLRLRPVR